VERALIREVQLGGRSIKDRWFYVVEQIIEGVDFLLGTPELAAFGQMSYDFDARVVRVGGRDVPIEVQRAHENSKEKGTHVWSLHVVEEVTLMPGQGRMVRAELAGKLAGVPGELMVEQLQKQYCLPDGLGVVPGLHPTLKGRDGGRHVFVHIGNTSFAPYRLKKGTRVAFGSRVDGEIIELDGESEIEQAAVQAAAATVAAGEALTEAKLKAAIRAAVEAETELTKRQKDQLFEVLWRRRKALALQLELAGQAKLPPHHIVLTDSQPIFVPNHRHSEAENELIEKSTAEMLKAKVVSPAPENTPWSAPIILVRKKTGELRTVVDFRRLNAVTQRDVYPLPRIDEILRRLQGAEFFSTFDLVSGYWQTPVAEEDRIKTAFRTRHGIYIWNVLPMGLTNAPSAFQRNMDAIFGREVGDYILVYLDDVITFSKTWEEHLHHIDEVLRRLEAHRLQAKLPKCKFARKRLLFLGLVVDKEGTRPNPDFVKAVVECLPPKNVAELRRFLSMVNWNRDFIPDLAKRSAPLYRLLKKHVQWQWGDEERAAFELLKQLLASSPVLIHARLGERFYVFIDAATGTSIGGALMQKDA